MTSSPMTSLNYCQKMCSQTRNSCAKAFDNRSRSKNLKPKKLRGGGGGQIDLKVFSVKDATEARSTCIVQV